MKNVVSVALGLLAVLVSGIPVLGQGSSWGGGCHGSQGCVLSMSHRQTADQCSLLQDGDGQKAWSKFEMSVSGLDRTTAWRSEGLEVTPTFCVQNGSGNPSRSSGHRSYLVPRRSLANVEHAQLSPAAIFSDVYLQRGRFVGVHAVGREEGAVADPRAAGSSRFARGPVEYVLRSLGGEIDESNNGVFALVVGGLDRWGHGAAVGNGVRRAGAQRIRRRLDPGRSTGSVLGDGEEAWTLNAEAGQVVSIDVRSTSFDTYVRLVGPNGQEIAADDDGGAGLDSRVLATLPDSGRYTVEVTAMDARSGAYDVEAHIFEVLRLPSDERTVGRLGPNGLAVWSFEGVTNQVVRVSARSLDFDTYIRLVSPNDEEVAADDDSGSGLDSQVVTRLPMSGRYQVWVTAIADGAGAYEVALDFVGDGAQASRSLVSTRGTLDNDEPGIWEFEGTAGKGLQLDVRSDEFDTYVRLLSPSGEEVATDDDGGRGLNSRISVTLRVSGLYRAEITAVDQQNGEYSVDIRTVDVRQLDLENRTAGTLGSERASVSSFAGATGDLLRIELGSDDFDPYVRVLSPSGEEIAADDDSGPGLNSMVLATLPESGLYQVEVTAVGRGSGNYVLEVHPVEVMETVLDRPMSGRLGRNGIAVWTFVGAADQVVRVQAGSDDFDTYLRLLSSGGEELAADDDSGSGVDAQLAAILPTDGLYQVEVTAVGQGGGDYSVEVVLR